MTRSVLEFIDIEPALPAGYEFDDDPSTIAGPEIVSLMRMVDIGGDVPDDHKERRSRIAAEVGIQIIDVGVRAQKSHELVGFGSLPYRGSRGELCDFVVHPDHQGPRIGRAILDRRLQIAARLGVESLFIGGLEPTNRLLQYYLDLGFHPNQHDEYVLGPDPQAVVVLKMTRAAFRAWITSSSQE